MHLMAHQVATDEWGMKLYAVRPCSMASHHKLVHTRKKRMWEACSDRGRYTRARIDLLSGCV